MSVKAVLLIIAFPFAIGASGKYEQLTSSKYES